MSNGPVGRSLNLDPDRWRSRADGPRWLYAAPGMLRVPWRLALVGVAMSIAQPITSSIVAPLFGSLSRAVGHNIPSYPWITLGTILLSLVVALRLVDQQPWSAIAFGRSSWRPSALMWGTVSGMAAIAATMALLWVTASVRIESAGTLPPELGTFTTSSWSGSATRLALLLAPAALWEELLFRGYLWRVAEDASTVRVARLSTAVAFGLVHVFNPGAGLLSTLLVVTAGFALGAVREHTNSLTAAWLAHLAWNWGMAAVFHVPVSGIPFDAPGYRTVISGPEWWTGGAWGPEGGAAALCVMIGALVIANRSRPGPMIVGAGTIDNAQQHAHRTTGTS